MRREPSDDGAWTLEVRDGLVLAICAALEAVPGIGHAFSTREADGRGDFDLGGADDATETVRGRRRRLVAAAGLGDGVSPVVLRQEHGAVVLRSVQTADGAEGDAALWVRGDAQERPPAVRTADCVPLLIADRHARAAIAVHAGWRGTARGIAGVAIRALGDAGIGPGELVAALGPAILSCCYEVERFVWEQVASASGGGEGLAVASGRADRVHLDLHAANRRQLERAGLAPAHIHAAPWCTRCRGDLLFSHRREGRAAGRHMAVVGPSLTARPP